MLNSVNILVSRRWPAAQINDNVTRANKQSKTMRPRWARKAAQRDARVPPGSHARTSTNPATRSSRKKGCRCLACQKEGRVVEGGARTGSGAPLLIGRQPGIDL